MIIDLNLIAADKLFKKYDVCICGAGPAGITIARKLAQAGKSVALLEGGGFEFSEQSQDSYAGQSIGIQYYEGLKYNRLRFFGGTSNHWAGRCSFYDDVDFERRSYFELPGWPIQRQEMMRHFDEAAEILDISGKGFSESQKQKWAGSNFRFSEYTLSKPTRFGQKYLNEVKQSANIDLYIHANLTDVILTGSHDEVAHYEVTNYQEQTFRFFAHDFVLALGGIENARLLLNCNKQIKAGIGNQADMVGRCFMEHLNVQLGRFVADDNVIWKSGAIQLNPSNELIRKLNIGNSVLNFEVSSEIVSYGRLGKLKTAIKEIVCKSDSITDFSRRLSDFNCRGDGVISTLMEQVPNLNSRVKLGNDKDHFGLRRIVLDWQLADQDYKTMHLLGIEVAKEMAKAGLARVRLNKFVLEKSKDVPEVGAHAHHLGTTRMSADSKFGVVDRNSRIHGIRNMYVAGSSVFSTGGGCNPTFTIVMLALRLAGYLNTK